MEPTDAPSTDLATEAHHVVVPVLWRYPEFCAHWGISRSTAERWVRRWEEHGLGIPVRRDPSDRPYWLAHEAQAGAEPARAVKSVMTTDDERVEGLRRAARRGRRAA